MEPSEAVMDSPPDGVDVQRLVTRWRLDFGQPRFGADKEHVEMMAEDCRLAPTGARLVRWYSDWRDMQPPTGRPTWRAFVRYMKERQQWGRIAGVSYDDGPDDRLPQGSPEARAWVRKIKAKLARVVSGLRIPEADPRPPEGYDVEGDCPF